MTLLDGKSTSHSILAQIATEVAQHIAQGHRAPHLAAVLVGDDGASETYVASKVKHCEQIGFASTLIRLASSTSEDELLATIEQINQNPEIDGLIVQMPLPKHISVERVTEAISPAKDVDGFHPINVGRMNKNLPAYISATPLGILLLLEHYGIETAGKHCVVLGRSAIVGSPMSILMARNAKVGNCTVTLCHSKTKDLAHHTRQADILIAALGIPEFVKADMIKPDAVVIDVGITRVADASKKSGFAIKGDVAFNEVAPLTSYITPVPGGVGLMTIAGLLYNTLQAAKGTYFPKN
jgi:methylenetetrahydrofolate dehydrogenase (NADP+)/methenyltetrahydrofolate cyclohydrolase